MGANQEITVLSWSWPCCSTRGLTLGGLDSWSEERAAEGLFPVRNDLSPQGLQRHCLDCEWSWSSSWGLIFSAKDHHLFWDLPHLTLCLSRYDWVSISSIYLRVRPWWGLRVNNGLCFLNSAFLSVPPFTRLFSLQHSSTRDPHSPSLCRWLVRG